MSLKTEPSKREYKQSTDMLRSDPKFISFLSWLIYGNTEQLLQLSNEELVYEMAFRQRLLEIYKEMKK